MQEQLVLIFLRFVLAEKWLSSFETYRCKSTILRFPEAVLVCHVPLQRRPWIQSYATGQFACQHQPPRRGLRAASAEPAGAFCR